MAEEHVNISLIKQFKPGDVAANAALFAEDVVWHFFNPRLPDIQGDYVGFTGLKSLFETLGALTAGTFHVEPVSITAVGDELVTTQTRNSMTIHGQNIVTDVVLVWRIVEGRVKEVWDIPSVYTVASTNR